MSMNDSYALRLNMLRQGLMLVAFGAVPGVIVTLFAARWLERLVTGAAAVTSAACFASLAPIAAVAAASVWTATNRISKLDPAVALRIEYQPESGGGRGSMRSLSSMFGSQRLGEC
jgi:hypothetical protein